MEVIKARNVHCALPLALERLGKLGVKRDSRNGPVVMFPTPVTTVYEKPTERVMFHPERDCNPFFHFFESLWMLAGRNDVAFPARFAKNMVNYSDDGKTFHGAYGYRWRSFFNRDQLPIIIGALKNNPDDRRCVLQMWAAESDLGFEGKDFPCNISALFSRDGEGNLDMTVYNRSNDIVWGTYGANAVHFSMLQEFMASSIGCNVGKYYQVSNNLHAYGDTLEKVGVLGDPGHIQVMNPYAREVEPFPLMQTSPIEWEKDLHMFLDEGAVVGLKDPFFRRVAVPMLLAHQAFKEFKGNERCKIAQDIMQQCMASDWKKACIEWLERRVK